MAIATLMGVCTLFLVLGWTGHAYTAAALSIGAIVCIASSNAGTTSQDLKTSFLVGGTPVKQQIAIMVGVITSVLVIGWTVQAINHNYTRVQEAEYEATLRRGGRCGARTGPDGRSYRVARAGGREDVPDGTYLVDDTGQVRFRVQEGIGSEKAPAPQATLMSLVTKGILTRQLPWGFVLIGVFTALLMEIIGVPALAFRSRHVPAPREHDPHLRGGARAQARGLAARRRGRIGCRSRCPLQLGPRGREARSWVWPRPS